MLTLLYVGVAGGIGLFPHRLTNVQWGSGLAVEFFDKAGGDTA